MLFHTSLVTIAALTGALAQGFSAAPSPTVTAAPGSLALGAECADTTQCGGGAECWASNSGLIRRCGNFNAGCTTDAQCAYNTCNNGLCNGFLPTPSSNSTMGSATMTSQASTTPAGPYATSTGTLLPLGALCSNTSQCAGAASCSGSSAEPAPVCGAFNATCSSDAQCYNNLCNQGLCNGYKPAASRTATSTGSSSTVLVTVPASGSSAARTVTQVVAAVPTMNATATATGPASATSSMVGFTGAAGRVEAVSGVLLGGAAALAAALL